MNIFKIGKKTREIEDRVWKLENPPKVKVGDDAFFYLGQGMGTNNSECAVYQKCKVAEINLYKDGNYRSWEYTVVYKGYIITRVSQYHILDQDPSSSTVILND